MNIDFDHSEVHLLHRELEQILSGHLPPVVLIAAASAVVSGVLSATDDVHHVLRSTVVDFYLESLDRHRSSPRLDRFLELALDSGVRQFPLRPPCPKPRGESGEPFGMNLEHEIRQQWLGTSALLRGEVRS